VAFAPLTHFFGYEGRCGLPSNFDADYCFTLGFTAGTLLVHGYTGVMAGVRNLTQDASKWEVFGLPLPSLMTIERRSGHDVAVIKKALVELDSKSFQHFAETRKKWIEEDCYMSPGPIQFFGKASQERPMVLKLDQ
jgi:pyrophosphate--fructose-6-phosphate 1-phosphotransferase